MILTLTIELTMIEAENWSFRAFFSEGSIIPTLFEPSFTTGKIFGGFLRHTMNRVCDAGKAPVRQTGWLMIDTVYWIASMLFLVSQEVMNSAATGSCSKFMD
jgi:hypothetical protein